MGKHLVRDDGAVFPFTQVTAAKKNMRVVTDGERNRALAEEAERARKRAEAATLKSDAEAKDVAAAADKLYEEQEAAGDGDDGGGVPSVDAVDPSVSGGDPELAVMEAMNKGPLRAHVSQVYGYDFPKRATKPQMLKEIRERLLPESRAVVAGGVPSGE